jgi:hypothetical protein
VTSPVPALLLDTCSIINLSYCAPVALFSVRDTTAGLGGSELPKQSWYGNVTAGHLIRRQDGPLIGLLHGSECPSR